MSRRIVLVAIAAALFVQPVFADFSRVATGLRKLGFESTWIPFLGLARTLVWVAQPNGIQDFQLAVYEKTPRVTGPQLQQMISRNIGKGYSPLVRVQSSRNRESVFVYAKPARNAKTIELLILAHEHDETVLVRVVANAEIVGRQLGSPIQISKMGMR